MSALCEIGEVVRARELCERLLSYASRARALRGGDRPALGPPSRQLPAGVHPPGSDQCRDARHPRRRGAGGRAAAVVRTRARPRAPAGRRSPVRQLEPRRTMSDIPAGWQPDPRGRHEYRYWDGTKWTDHVSDKGEVSQDPVDDVTPAGGAATARRRCTPPPITPTDPGTPSETPPSSRDAAACRRARGVRAGALAGAEPTPSPSRSRPRARAASPPGRRPPRPRPRPPRPGTSRPTPSTATGRRGDEGQGIAAPLSGKSPELATILSASSPAPATSTWARRSAVAAGLLVATLVAVVLACMSFLLFIVGFVIWAGAAVFALSDLRGGRQGSGRPAAANSSAGSSSGPAPCWSSRCLLPYYHVKVDVSVGGLGGMFGNAVGERGGLRLLDVIDIILFVVGIAAVARGPRGIGKGPIRPTAADVLPMIVAVGRRRRARAHVLPAVRGPGPGLRLGARRRGHGGHLGRPRPGRAAGRRRRDRDPRRVGERPDHARAPTPTRPLDGPGRRGTGGPHEDRLLPVLRGVRPRQSSARAAWPRRRASRSLWISDHYHPWTDEQGESPFVWSVIGALSQVTERIPGRHRRDLPVAAHPPGRDRPGRGHVRRDAAWALRLRGRQRRGAQRAHPGRPLAVGRRPPGDARGVDRTHPRAVDRPARSSTTAPTTGSRTRASTRCPTSCRRSSSPAWGRRRSTSRRASATAARAHLGSDAKKRPSASARAGAATSPSSPGRRSAGGPTRRRA